MSLPAAGDDQDVDGCEAGDRVMSAAELECLHSLVSTIIVSLVPVLYPPHHTPWPHINITTRGF